MSDHININHPNTRARFIEHQSQIKALQAKIDILEVVNHELSSDLEAIFTRIARNEQAELHYPDGQVVLITKARKRNSEGAEE